MIEQIIYISIIAILIISLFVMSHKYSKREKLLKRRLHDEYKDEANSLEKQKFELEEKLQKINNDLLEEKRSTLDLKHRIVDMIARNQEIFKDFDTYIKEKGWDK